LRGLRAASASFATTDRGVAPSGLPIPKSTTSYCAARSLAFISLTAANTYGGSLAMR
jgi:hypothetical protein